MTGRLAPGVNVEPAMPGRYCRESARLAPGVATISRSGTSVSGTNTSSMIMGVVGSWGWLAPALAALGRRTGGGGTPLDGAGRRHRDPRQVHLRLREPLG